VARACPRCGREGVEFIGPLCVDCYREVYGLSRLPRRLDFVYCAYCGAYRIEGGWSEGSGTLEERVVEYLHLALTRRIRPAEHVDEAWVERVEPLKPVKGPGLAQFRVVVGARAGGVEAREERVVEVNLKPSVCPVCTARITARGYEAVVQVRSSEGRLSDWLRRGVDEFLMSLDARLRSSILKVEERREGIDLLVHDQASARMIAAKLRAAFLGKTIETYKLVGRRPDGSRKGRLTVSVRLPDIKPGDLVEVGGRPSLYLAKARDGALFVDLKSGREVHVSADELWERGFRRLGSPPELRRLMLLSRGGPTTVFLAPAAGYAGLEVPSRDVRVYTDRLVEGEEYLAYMSGRRIYVIRRAPEAGGEG